jgi:hypothetical protein
LIAYIGDFSAVWFVAGLVAEPQAESTHIGSGGKHVTSSLPPGRFNKSG